MRKTSSYRFNQSKPEEELTQVTHGVLSRPRITAVLVAAVLGAAIAAAALVVATRRTPNPVVPEDPLVLYQVARELHENGDDPAALSTIARARRQATHIRARRQLDALQREIELSPHLRNAREQIEAERYDSARAELSHILSRDPRNEQAFLLMQLLQQRTAVREPRQRPAADAMVEPEQSVSSIEPTQSAENDSHRLKNRGERDRVRNRRSRRVREMPTSSEGTRRGSPSIEAGTIDVQSNVAGRVWLDGHLTHQDTPVVLTLEPGLHTVELIPSSDPSTRLQKRVMVQSGQVITVRFEVARSTSAANGVTTNGIAVRPVTSAAQSAANRSAANGLPANGLPVKAPVPPDTPASPPAAMPSAPRPAEPTNGSVYVLTDTPGYVFVDGVNTGKVTPVRLQLPPGRHEIVIVVQRTNERIRHEIDVKPGKLIKLRFRIEGR